MEPTSDTPQERNNKADEVERVRQRRARDLARSLRIFQWEMRFYFVALCIYMYASNN